MEAQKRSYKIKKYIGSNSARAIIENDFFKDKDIFCQIQGKEHKVRFVNTNNKTFSAERNHTSNLFNFEDFAQIEEDQFFYRKK